MNFHDNLKQYLAQFFTVVEYKNLSITKPSVMVEYRGVDFTDRGVKQLATITVIGKIGNIDLDKALQALAVEVAKKLWDWDDCLPRSTEPTRRWTPDNRSQIDYLVSRIIVEEV